MSGTPVIVEAEVAEREFERFADIWDIDSDLAGMSLEDRSSFDAQKSRVIREIVKGVAVVDEEANVIYTLKHPKEGGSTSELTFKVTRANKAVMDQYKDRETMHKTAAYIGTLAGLPPKIIFALDPRDQKFGEAIAVLFLGS